MPFAHVLGNVEMYKVTQEGHGVFGDELRIAGWLLCDGGVDRIQVVVDGSHVFDVTHIGSESQGVWEHHGASFGEQARHCRYTMMAKLPSDPLAFATNALRFVSGGKTFEIGLDPPERPEPVSLFTPRDAELVMGFESIGDQCEFGLMQRRVGTERMGLFRYAGIADAMALVRTLQQRFEGFAEGDDLQISNFGPEWIADVRSASANFHTGRIMGDIGREEMERQERVKLAFLADKLRDDIEDATRVFVYRTMQGQRGGPDGTFGMDAVYDAMAAIGPATLLWVNQADDAHPHGTIQHVRGRLFRAWHRKLCPYDDAHTGDDAGWVDLLGRARDAFAAHDVQAAPVEQAVPAVPSSKPRASRGSGRQNVAASRAYTKRPSTS